MLLFAVMDECRQVSARRSDLTLCLVSYHSNGDTDGITFQFNAFKSGLRLTIHQFKTSYSAAERTQSLFN